MASVAEILLAQGQRSADARRRMGEIQAGMWRDVGQIAGNTIQTIGKHYADEPARRQAQEINDLKLVEARAGVAALEGAAAREAGFREAMQSGRPRQEILDSLKGDPAMYETASKNYELIDRDYRRYLGTMAASVRMFKDSPEAAMAALDDMIAKGHDERQLDQFRGQIQKDPTSVTALVDGFLKGSPDEAHRQMVAPVPKAPEPFTLSPGQQRFGLDGKPVASVAPEVKPVTFSSPEPALINGRRSFIRGGSDGFMYGPDGKKLEPGAVEPIPPRTATGGGGAMPSFQAKEVLNDDGQPVMANFDSRSGRYVDPSGRPIQNPRPVPNARPVTGAERQSLAFYNRARSASDDIAPLETEVARLSTAGQTRMQWAPNFFQSQLGQSYRQAQRAFTEARLRKESGATIPPHEYENDAQTYFAVPGDKPPTLIQKREAREKVLQGLGYTAGKAFEEFYGEPMPRPGNHKIGDVVNVRGQRVRITKVNPDGTFEGQPGPWR